MGTIASLAVMITANAAQYEKTLKRMVRTAKNVGKEMSDVGRTLTTGITAPVVGLGAAAVMAAGRFDTSMRRVAALSGATEDQFGQLEAKARELGATTSFSASQAADAMGFLAMAGFNTNQIIAAMPSTLQLAEAAQLDLATAADITSNILTGYGKTTEDLAQVNDVLVKAFTSANTNLQQLGEAMKYAGPVANSAGIRFEETAAAIGMMGNAGIQASMAGTSLRGAITRLLKPTGEAASTIERLGVQVTDSQGKMVPLVDIVRQLEKSGATTSDMMTIFGQRAGPAMQALVDQGADALANFTAKLENSGGVAQRIADQQMEGFRGATKRMQSALEAAAISIGNVMLPKINQLAERVTVISTRFAALDEGTQKQIIRFAMMAAAVGPLLLVMGGTLKTVAFMATGLRGLTRAFRNTIRVVRELTAAKVAMQIKTLLIIAAIAALAAAAFLVVKNWEQVKVFFGDLWKFMVTEFKSGGILVVIALREMQLAVARVLDFMLGNVSRWLSDLIGRLKILHDVPIIGPLVQKMEQGLQDLGDTTQRFVQRSAAALDEAKGKYAETAKGTSASMSVMVKSAKELGGAMGDTIKDSIDSVKKFVTLGGIFEDTAAKATEAAEKQADFGKAALDAAQAAEDQAEAMIATEEQIGATAEAAEEMTEKTERMVSALDILGFQLERLDSAWQIQKSGMDANATAAQKLADEQGHLERKLALVKEQVALLQGQYGEALTAAGEFAKETMDAAKALDRAAVEQARLEREIADTARAIAEETKEAERATQAIEDKARAMRQAEGAASLLAEQINDVGGALQDAQMDIRATEAALNRANAAVEQAQKGYDGWETVLGRVQGALDKTKASIDDTERAISDARGAIQSAFSAMTDHVSDLERQISSANQAIRDLTGVRFVGETALLDQLQGLQRQITATELAIVRSERMGGTPELEGLQARLENLRLEERELRLMQRFQFDLLRDDLKRLADDTKEVPFAEAAQRIEEEMRKRANLTTEIDSAKKQMEDLQRSVAGVMGEARKLSFDEAVAAVERHKRAIEENQATLGTLKQKYAEQQTILQFANEEMAEFKTRLEEDLLPAQKAAAEAFENAQKRAASLAEEHDRLREKMVNLREAMDALRSGTGDMEQAARKVAEATADIGGLPAKGAGFVAGQQSAAELAARLTADQMRQFLTTRAEKDAPGGVTQAFRDVLRNLTTEQLQADVIRQLERFKGELPSFGNGGKVPGSPTDEVMARLHGGERVLTPAQQRMEGGGDPRPLVVQLVLGGRVVEEVYVSGKEIATRRGRN